MNQAELLCKWNNSNSASELWHSREQHCYVWSPQRTVYMPMPHKCVQDSCDWLRYYLVWSLENLIGKIYIYVYAVQTDVEGRHLPFGRVPCNWVILSPLSDNYLTLRCQLAPSWCQMGVTSFFLVWPHFFGCSGLFCVIFLFGSFSFGCFGLFWVFAFFCFGCFGLFWVFAPLWLIVSRLGLPKLLTNPTLDFTIM